MTDASLIADLLDRAGVPATDAKARRWLADAIRAARSMNKAAKNAPIPVDHNAPLEAVEAAATDLLNQLKRLRVHHHAAFDFWRSDLFEPIEMHDHEREGVVDLIAVIQAAAARAMNKTRGTPKKHGQRAVVDLACGFFARFSPHPVSGTQTGRFANFARTFSEATGGSRKIDRQVREVAKDCNKMAVN